jgi:hypothetical protein
LNLEQVKGGPGVHIPGLVRLGASLDLGGERIKSLSVGRERGRPEAPVVITRRAARVARTELGFDLPELEPIFGVFVANAGLSNRLRFFRGASSLIRCPAPTC